ncbi:MAG: Ig-like domain-containing protein [Oscillospiraceae bacterium]
MAANRKPGSRPGLIHCENCGEDYSASYRRCPFCDEYAEYEDSYARPERTSSRSSGGGKRLAQSKRRGGGYTRTSPLKVISIIISLAVILFAAWIVVTKVMPMVQRGDVGTVDPNSSPSSNSASDPTPDSSPDASPDISEQPAVSPAPGTSAAPSSDTATGFTLNKSEFAFSDQWPNPITLEVTFTPAGSTATITWTSSDPDVASVDENGTVSHGSKRGSATITAAMSNGVTQTCTVYNQLSNLSTSGSNGGNSTTASTNYTINNPDFTFDHLGETYQLKVKNYTGGVTWSSSNTSVATVSSNGTCTAVGSGKCTVTGTLDDGSKVTAIVRVSL